MLEEYAPIPLPVSANEVSCYTDRANAVVNVVPTPIIYKHQETETALYLYLRWLISLYLLYKLPVSTQVSTTLRKHCLHLTKKMRLAATKRVHNIVNEEQIDSAITLEDINPTESKKLFLCIWSDGFDPKARNKQTGVQCTLLQLVFCGTFIKTVNWTLMLFQSAGKVEIIRW